MAQAMLPARICAYCLQPPKEDASLFLCGGCQRRAYCSKGCAAQDWKKSSTGQGHKYWCNLSAGEEGLDWEVRHISSLKGFGIVALRTLPPGFKVIVERALSFHEATIGPEGNGPDALAPGVSVILHGLEGEFRSVELHLVHRDSSQ